MLKVLIPVITVFTTFVIGCGIFGTLIKMTTPFFVPVKR